MQYKINQRNAIQYNTTQANIQQRPGKPRQDNTNRDKTIQHNIRRYKARQGRPTQHIINQGKTIQYTTISGLDKIGKIRQYKAIH